MANQQGKRQDGSGSIRFVADKASDRHPDLKGSVTIAGVKYWVSGWQREKDGEIFYSLALDAAGGDGESALTKPGKPGTGGTGRQRRPDTADAPF